MTIGLVGLSKEQHNKSATNQKQFLKSDRNIADLTLLGVVECVSELMLDPEPFLHSGYYQVFISGVETNQ